MIYSECKPEHRYNYKFYWYVTDESANEFLTCDNCCVEAPLHYWSFASGSNWLCEICSNMPQKTKAIIQAGVANLVLTQMGYFDNVEVRIYQEEYGSYETN